jgi:pimeloyl-ACP methyl ester carboxylesterase
VVGHSWGTLVALELAMHYPHDVKRLLLLSGYYFPTFRPDVAIFAAPALPVVGDVMRYTISPLLGRLTAPQVTAQMFAPNPVAPQFTASLPMTLRPSQLRAAAQDTACMVPGAASAAKGYGALTMPTAIVAGRGDKIVEYTQSERLAATLDEARLLIVEDSGHMVHYTATDTVVQTIATLAGATPSDEGRSYAGV